MLDKRTEKAFLGKVRHNLKNPVNAILGYSEMLIEDCEDHNKSDPISRVVLISRNLEFHAKTDRCSELNCIGEMGFKSI